MGQGEPRTKGGFRSVPEEALLRNNNGFNDDVILLFFLIYFIFRERVREGER